MASGRPRAGLQGIRKALAVYLTQPVVRLLSRTPITPNALTVCSFVVILGAAGLLAAGHLVPAGLVVLFSGFFDILDGALARATNRVTRFGAVLDSTLDRLAEAVVLIGLLVVFARDQSVVRVVLAGVTLVSSFMVSYVRARAEGLGVDCEVGVFTRTERLIALVLGLLLSQFAYVLEGTLVVITVFSSITVGQRLYRVWQRTRT